MSKSLQIYIGFTKSNSNVRLISMASASVFVNKLGISRSIAASTSRGILWSRPFSYHSPGTNRNYSAENAQLQIKNPAEVSVKEAAAVDPLQFKDYFGVSSLFTVKDLFKARVHLGHKEGSLNVHMRPFVFGSRLGHLIFDLDQTAEHLREALNFAAHVAFRKGIILFVNRNPFTSLLVEDTAKECGEYAHVRPWAVGSFPNSAVEYGAATRLPDLVICLSVLDSVLDLHMVVPSAAKMLIPTIGITDTNCDPTLVTYPVPGNDDTYVAVKLYCQLFKKAVMSGKQKRKELEEKGVDIIIT